MKDYLMLLAKHNAHANRQLYEVVAPLPADQLNKEVGSYFGSLYGVLNHLYGSDCRMLLRIKDNLESYPALESALLKDPMPAGREPVFADFATLNAKRPQMDELIERFVSELTEGDLAKRFTIKLRSGVEKSLLLWQTLAHIFNHETHHRGAAAQILDEMGVTNDYSNVMSLL